MSDRLKELRKEYEATMKQMAAVKWQLLCIKDEVNELECPNKKRAMREVNKALELFNA